MKNKKEKVAEIEAHSWNSEPEVGYLLGLLLKTEGKNDVLEIGVFKGQTYLGMSEHMKSYVGIDIEDHRTDLVKQQMETNKELFILGDSLAELAKLPEKAFDLIFIDSVHEYEHCFAEFKMCERLIRKGGLMCFHDTKSFPGVLQVVNYIKLFKHFDVLTLDTPNGNGLTIVKCNYE